MDILLSSAEVYKKECLGFLLGYRLLDRFIVEHAFSFQTARRRPKGVSFHDRNHKKIQPIISSFEKLQIIGDFHSHTQFGNSKGIPIPSEEDIAEMEAANVYIIAAINNTEKRLPWRENRDGSLSGGIGDFFFKIAAFFLKEGKTQPRRGKIYCQFPSGFREGS